MTEIRLIYFSEIRISGNSGGLTKQLNEILDIAERRNKNGDITGCLLFDKRWFVQTLEGPCDNVLDVYKSIVHDFRHTNVNLVQIKKAPFRYFAGWWMRCVQLDPDVPEARMRYLLSEDFVPSDLSGDLLLSLMTGHQGKPHLRPAST